MTAIIAAFLPYIAGAFAALVAALMALLRINANRKRKLDKAEDALKMNERINDARIEKDPDAAREWLAAHGRKLRDERKP